MKIRASITLDPVLKVWAEQKIENLSGFVESQIRGLRDMTEDESELGKEVTELEQEVKDLEKLQRQLSNEACIKLARINELKEEKKKKNKEILDKSLAMTKSIEDAGLLYGVGEW